tara:strand:+ start:16897 stop:17880 length:984 start_codon:yes stop_codon:yes gene_type:complete
MAMGAEEIWLEALEMREKGDFIGAVKLAKEVVDIDVENSEAWMAIAMWSLPPPTKGKPVQPTLQQSAKSISALKKVILYEPENLEAWVIGGKIMIDHLGMLEDSLQWWEDCRVQFPTNITPVLEQIAVLVRLGLYEECAERLAELESGEMEEPTNQQTMRMQGVKGMVERASKMEKDEIFRPQEASHPRWEIIERMKKVKPLSSTFWLVAFIAPVVFIFGSLCMAFLGDTMFGLILVFLLILGAFGLLTRLSMGLLQSRNRHALDVDRAIDYETSTGKLCIPESIRGSAVYKSMLKNRSPAVKERLEIIIESGEKISSKYQPILPNW